MAPFPKKHAQNIHLFSKMQIKIENIFLLKSSKTITVDFHEVCRE
jgi:hypothetical protein